MPRDVHHTKNSGLLADSLRSPGEVTSFKTEGSELGGTTASANQVDLLGSNLGVGGRAAQLELSLLAHGLLLTTGQAALVNGTSGDTLDKGVSQDQGYTKNLH